MNTTYSREIAETELLKFNNNHLKVIDNYIQNKSTINNSSNNQTNHSINRSNVNREIFTQCRKLMDVSMAGYNERSKVEEETKSNTESNSELKIKEKSKSKSKSTITI
jgi:hypothetical protein